MFDRCFGSWLLIGCLISLSAVAATPDDGVIRIGYQKYSSLYLLKLRGDLDRRLAGLGKKVAWSEFQYGVPMLEALNAGQLDFATTGETPPVIAQSRRGSELVYVGQEPPSPESEGILVQGDSSIRALADLRGKRVAVAKGANVHYLLLRALEKAGLGLTEIEWVFLAPGDASSAFKSRAIDAWAIWDFQKALAEQQTGARTLVDGRGLVENFECYTTRRTFLEEHPELIKIFIEELAKTDEWILGHTQEAVLQLARELGVDQKSLNTAYGRRHFGATTSTPELRSNQARIAETLLRYRLIPAPLDIGHAFPAID